jgi:hypothetical protein
MNSTINGAEMRRRNLLAALLVPALAACASGGSGGDGPMGLAMGMPEGGTVTYEIADTTVIAIDAMGQMMEIPATGSTTITATFAPNATGGVRMTATVADFESVMSNPMGAPERASGDDIEGELVVDYDRRGVAEVVGIPALSGTAEQMFSPEQLAHGMFPRLPGTPPTPGMTWTDTITTVVDRAGTFTESTQIITWTVPADGIQGAMVRIDYTGTMEMEQEGMQMGMSFTQDLQGASEGHVIWDMAASRMEEHHSTSTLDGVMDADQVPVPLPLSVVVTQVIRRTAGM